jgi:hypothetical protein
VAGFEPAISRPPAERFCQTKPHPEMPRIAGATRRHPVAATLRCPSTYGLTMSGMTLREVIG